MDRSELEELVEGHMAAFEEIATRERRYPTGAAAGFALVAIVAGLMGGLIVFALGRLL